MGNYGEEQRHTELFQKNKATVSVKNIMSSKTSNTQETAASSAVVKGASHKRTRNYYYSYKLNGKVIINAISVPSISALNFTTVKRELIIPYLKSKGINGYTDLTYERAKNADGITPVPADIIAPIINLNGVNYDTHTGTKIISESTERTQTLTTVNTSFPVPADIIAPIDLNSVNNDMRTGTKIVSESTESVQALAISNSSFSLRGYFHNWLSSRYALGYSVAGQMECIDKTSVYIRKREVCTVDIWSITDHSVFKALYDKLLVDEVFLRTNEDTYNTFVSAGNLYLKFLKEKANSIAKKLTASKVINSQEIYSVPVVAKLAVLRRNTNYYFTYKLNSKVIINAISVPSKLTLNFTTVKKEFIMPYLISKGISTYTDLTWERVKNADSITPIPAHIITPIINLNGVNYDTRTGTKIATVTTESVRTLSPNLSQPAKETKPQDVDFYKSELCERRPVSFQGNDKSILKIGDAEPYIMFSLFVSDEVVIHMVSRVIDVAKTVRLFIENHKYINEYVSQETESEAVLIGLSICSNSPWLPLVPKPIQPIENLLTDHKNTYSIKFQDCDEFAAGEVYDRLLYAMSGICDYFATNDILKNLKELVLNANPLFTTAKVARLLGYIPTLFEKQSIYELSDVFKMIKWDVSVSVAKGIYSSIDKQINLLVDPSDAIESLTADLSERQKYIIENRYLRASRTLEELGSELGITRERVRQIAANVERKFKTPCKLNLIKAVFFSLQVLCECEYCFTIDELKKFGVSESALMFFSGVLEDKYNLVHIYDTNCIALYEKCGKCEWLEYIKKVADSIPALLLHDESQNIIQEISSSLAEAGYFIPGNIIAAIAFQKYFKNGTVRVKKSLSIGDRYEIVLEKFFPNGINPYRTGDMKLFRKAYATLFDDDKISDNDHAVIARVADRCVLIDRGTYILNKKTELPANLSRRILNFILRYPYDMIMTNAIMHRFNTELAAIGVDNKYYLLSVLKQHFSNKFSFRRDYVIKGEDTGNFYSNITGFVQSNPEGISFHELQGYFEGIPDAVLYFALSEDDSIIPMYNKMYTHKSNIIFPEQQQVLGFLQGVISQEHIVSDERAYGLLKRNYPDFIANNNINTSWFLFSILRSFFPDEFKFSRPHIIDSSFDSANGREALRSSFWGKRYVNISDIKDYAKEKQIQIYDLSKLLDSYSDRYFILNKEQLISIDEIGYSFEEFAQVEDIIIKALKPMEYSEIAKLNVINLLPKATVKLTEWIIYSIINKYGTQLSVTTSTPQFMNSVPLVFRNSIDIETVRDDYVSSGAVAQTVRIDDLSDIDRLVEGIIDLDFVWEDGKR